MALVWLAAAPRPGRTGRMRISSSGCTFYRLKNDAKLELRYNTLFIDIKSSSIIRLVTLTCLKSFDFLTYFGGSL